jgi:signal transduction histidine kinase
VRRRITVAMVAMVAIALLLAGTVTFVASIHAARADNRRELLSEARGLTLAVQREADTAAPRDPALSLRRIIRALKAPLRLQDDAVVALTTAGVLFDPASLLTAPRLPSGLQTADLDIASLLALHTVSGHRGSLVYVAAPYRTRVRIGSTNRQVVEVVVLTRDSPSGLTAAGPWFLGAAAVIILAAVAVADRLGRRFLRPLRAAQLTTAQIAAGDLDARVPAGLDVDPELASLSSSVNTMAESLARARDGERMFLLSVSHDLRTPLTSIRGFAEAIEDGVTPDTSRAAATIVAESRRLERLVGDLLDLAKLEARQFVLHPGPLDPARILADTAAGFAPQAVALGLALRVQVDEAASGGPVAVLADGDRLAQVVANLVENALSFARTQVRVGAGQAPGSALLWVDDDGPGIGADKLPRVFERLYASRPESPRPVGSGLGLAIVSELVTAMGGRVWAESPLLGRAGGTRMVVTLPTLRPPDGP